MGSIFFELSVLFLVCTLMFTFVFILQTRRKDDKDTDSDDEGGLPVNLPPDIDLPPGVCLPDDPKRHKIIEHEEVFA